MRALPRLNVESLPDDLFHVEQLFLCRFGPFFQVKVLTGNIEIPDFVAGSEDAEVADTHKAVILMRSFG